MDVSRPNSYTDFFEIIQPIIETSTNKQIGIMHIHYSKQEYNKIVSKQLNILLGLLLLSFVFALISSVYIRKALSPLHDLADKLADTSIHQPVQPIERQTGIDEISIIQNKICDAFEKVAEYRQEIEDTNKNLENLVEARTIKLTEALEDVRQKEDMLLVQSRFSAMGEMIANIAHQWRQPLNVIKASASMLSFYTKMDKMDTALVLENSQQIQSQADYLSQTIEDFRSFYQDGEKDSFSISHSVTKALSLISASYANNHIAFKFVDSADDTLIGSESKLTQVIINLLNNSRDAILDKKIQGVVVVSIEDTENSIIISVQDNAGGIKEDVLPKIFEPYFTTKHKSQGTGLGLYMSKQIIEKHLGSVIWAENRHFEYEDDKFFGACFKIRFNKTNHATHDNLLI